MKRFQLLVSFLAVIIVLPIAAYSQQKKLNILVIWGDSARENILVLVDRFIKGISRFDSEMAGTDAEGCVFRIYRDIRFSKNKTPYRFKVQGLFN